jgi:glucoamylase
MGTQTCDLWEEIQSQDIFWNKVNMRRALLMGVNFVSDKTKVQTYQNGAEQLDQDLKKHWNGN